jgi:tetratricopeptide (TPR) repeat protein
VSKLFHILALSTALGGPAWALDKPLVGPAPPWVRPVTAPPVPPKDDAAVRYLLSDQQVSIGDGEQTVYLETAIVIQTPQGLAAGNLSFPWRSELDTLTVHKIRIRRGAETIDVLASGQSFTVARREQNLDSAVLDGILTANIQPEGLQVGDVLEIAFSSTSRDPTLKGHAEFAGAAWNGIPIERAHFRMEWPAGRTMRLRTTPTLPAVRPVKSGAMLSAEITLDKAMPIIAPKGAPPRYQIGRLLQATDFASWQDLSRLLAPLYTRAAVIPVSGPLRVELDRIRAQGPNPVAQAEAALALVQDRVRYVALAMGAGGLVPAPAETTWSRRYGDCKAKTALLLALLRELGIKADPVAVNGTLGDGMNERLPMVGNFDHVLVRAEVGGRTVWMDGTRVGDTTLDGIAVPAFGWGLPLTSEGADLVRLMPPPLAKPGLETTVELDARAGLSLPAPAKLETVFRGDDAISVNAVLGNLSGEPREHAIRQFWKGRFDFIEPKSVASSFDAKARELRLRMDGVATMDWSGGRFETSETDIGYKADFDRGKSSDTAAPFVVAYPIYTRMVERILLPPGFAPDQVSRAGAIDETVAGMTYKRTTSLENDVFTVDVSQRSIAPEFPAAEAAAAAKRLGELADQSIAIRRPKRYQPTERELAAMLQQAPTTVEALLERGNHLLDARRFDEALKDFDAAVTLAPRDANALSGRGLAHVWKRDFPQAARDFDAAFGIDPQNAVVFRGRGLAALWQRDYAASIQAFTTALAIDPSNVFARARRAQAYRGLGDGDKAIEDATAALKLAPAYDEMGWLRYSIYRERNQLDRAFASLEEMIAGAPRNTAVLVTAAIAYARAGNHELALRNFDRALAVKPEAWIYLERAQSRPDDAHADRRADLDAALALDPTFEPATLAKAELMIETGAFADAAQIYTAMLEKKPEEPGFLATRGIALAKAGRMSEANRDFAAARRVATSAESLNNLCWGKVLFNVALDAALAECDAAQKLAPTSNPIRDSRAMVLLRLGRLDDAIAEFDKVLASDARYPSSRLGRSLAHARKGNLAQADLDLAEARKLDPDVERSFTRYGLSR